MSRHKRDQQLLKRIDSILRRVLAEWDCQTLEEAKERAKTDNELHYRLREAGVTFSDCKAYILRKDKGNG